MHEYWLFPTNYNGHLSIIKGTRGPDQFKCNVGLHRDTMDTDTQWDAKELMSLIWGISSEKRACNSHTAFTEGEMLAVTKNMSGG